MFSGRNVPEFVACTVAISQLSTMLATFFSPQARFETRVSSWTGLGPISTIFTVKTFFLRVTNETSGAKSKMIQEARSVYVDAAWCDRDDSGSLHYSIPGGIEVPGNDLVCYSDDYSVAGVVSAVNASTNKLYLLERSPKGFSFASPTDFFYDANGCRRCLF